MCVISMVRCQYFVARPFTLFSSQLTRQFKLSLVNTEAYEFYSEFAKRCGFSIRRHRTEGKDGVGKGLTRRYFVCHRAGNTPIKTSNESKPQRNRKSSRCGCQAYLRISKTTELGAPEWRVTGFANHHNHELLEPNQQMMRLMELEKCVEPGYLPFTEKDVRNLLQSFRKLDPEDESIDLLRMCRNIKDKDPNFKFEFTLDPSNRLENITCHMLHQSSHMMSLVMQWCLIQHIA
ncbi:Protein FAR1-related sequence 11 [Vitis vinifera]|uniref:Protein FAR1-related sequence 11 n=1 Tax=Vitis vinifera TaxID=29760 RepID=A0A438E9G6_VITVI|nr:Protein FAR1-related sequence 11 [Vitis vinifera]